MKKQVLIAISFLLLLSSHSLHAQWDDGLWVGKQANNWIFYYDVGLDFSTSPPTVNTNCNTTLNNFGFAEGVGTISDSSGNLLFSVSKDSVWNKNYQLMNYGNGYPIVNDISAMQTHLTIPKPGPGNEYYILQIDDNWPGWADDLKFFDDLSILPQGLAYTMVDMDLDNGLGAVTSKNNLLTTKVSEKLTAVHHADGKKVWVITHEGTYGFPPMSAPPVTSNKFLAFLVSSSGIATTPVVSPVGLPTSYSLGQMKVSPNGEKIAFVVNGTAGMYLQVFDFDNATGIISNPIDLSTALKNSVSFEGGWGLEFSPNSRYLYVTETGGAGATYSYLHQFDLEAGNQAAVLASVIELAKIKPAHFATLQLAPNGKIYMAHPTRMYQSFDPTATGHLSVINYPNNYGVAAGFNYLGVDLNGKSCSLGFPGFIQSYFESGILHEGKCAKQTVNFTTLRIPGIQSITWDFGDPNSGADNIVTSPQDTIAHIFSGPGTYTVTATITSNGAQQTATTEITIIEGAVATQPDNLVACDDGIGNAVFDLTQQDSAILNGQDPSTHTLTYHTSQNDAQNNTRPITNPSQYVSPGQTIYVRVSNMAGCYGVSQFDLIVAPTPQLPDSLEITGCSPVDITSIAGQVNTNLSLGYYLSENDAMAGTNPIANPGEYTFSTSEADIYLKGTNQEGCSDVAKLHLLQGGCAIPQGISPNGDQWNQSFDLSYMNIQKLEIFNRYGRSVFNKESYTDEWFGQTDNGDELPTGTYFYVIKLEEGYTFQGKSTLTGWVYVQREATN